MFLNAIDYSNPKHMQKLVEIRNRHEEAYRQVANSKMLYDDIVTSKKAVVELYGGGLHTTTRA